MITMNYTGIQLLAKNKRLTPDDQEEVPLFVKRVLKDFKPEDLDLPGVKDTVRYHQLLAGQVVVIPCGYALIERTLLSHVNEHMLWFLI